MLIEDQSTKSVLEGPLDAPSMGEGRWLTKSFGAQSILNLQRMVPFSVAAVTYEPEDV